MVSRRGEATRVKILEAARRLLIEHGYHHAGMGEIARAAGVSRQTVYLHFGSKAELFVAMVDEGDRAAGLDALLRQMDEARTPVERLMLMVSVQGHMGPRNQDIVRVLYAARSEEPAAEAAWQNRMQARHRGCRRIVQGLADEGVLREELSVDDATDLLWTLVSAHTYAYLVVERRWPVARYVEQLQQVVKRALLR